MPAIPAFETERLLLRGVSLDDIPSYTRHFVDYEVIRNLAIKVPCPYPENGVETHIRESLLPHQGNDKWVWGIFMKNNLTELIGCIDLWRKGTPENRGFWLGRAYWGKGIMTEAVQPVMNYAFGELGFEKLVFSNALGNIASRKVKEKTRCRYIGIMPGEFVDPAFTQRELWELTKEEWMLKRI